MYIVATFDWKRLSSIPWSSVYAFNRKAAIDFDAFCKCCTFLPVVFLTKKHLYQAGILWQMSCCIVNVSIVQPGAVWLASFRFSRNDKHMMALYLSCISENCIVYSHDHLINWHRIGYHMLVCGLALLFHINVSMQLMKSNKRAVLKLCLWVTGRSLCPDQLPLSIRGDSSGYFLLASVKLPLKYIFHEM